MKSLFLLSFFIAAGFLMAEATLTYAISKILCTSDVTRVGEPNQLILSPGNLSSPGSPVTQTSSDAQPASDNKIKGRVMFTKTGTNQAAETGKLPLNAPMQSEPDNLATPHNKLKGGVLFLKTEVGLHELGESIGHLRRSTLDMINEVERRQLVMVGEPTIIGPIVLPAIVEPTGQFPMGNALPARKDWVDIWTKQIRQYVDLVHKEVDSVYIPSNQKNLVKNNWKTIEAVDQNMLTHYRQLYEVTRGPVYNNIDIGKAALAIYDDTSRMEKPWKQVFKIIRGEIKS